MQSSWRSFERNHEASSAKMVAFEASEWNDCLKFLWPSRSELKDARGSCRLNQAAG